MIDRIIGWQNAWSLIIRFRTERTEGVYGKWPDDLISELEN